MTGLRVTPEQLSDLGTTTARVSAQLRADHESLHAQLMPLFGSEWTGAAASQFSSLYDDFDRHARGMCDALDGVGALLGRAGSTYAQVEQQIAASFR